MVPYSPCLSRHLRKLDGSLAGREALEGSDALLLNEDFFDSFYQHLIRGRKYYAPFMTDMIMAVQDYPFDENENMTFYSNSDHIFIDIFRAHLKVVSTIHLAWYQPQHPQTPHSKTSQTPLPPVPDP